MYKAMPPFGKFSCRLEAIAELKRQLVVINDAVDAQVPKPLYQPMELRYENPYLGFQNPLEGRMKLRCIGL